MTLTIQWYERKSDLTTDYDKRFVETIEGKSAADCMAIFRMEGQEHDLAKYTDRRIINVED